MIIAITGRKFSGKDTSVSVIRSIIKDEARIYHLTFAKPIKQASMALFNLTEQDLNDPIAKEMRLSGQEWSPREIMQKLGTAVRETFGQDFFINHVLSLINSITNNDDKIIIVSDVRYDREAQFLKDKGAIVVKIKRDKYESGTDTHTSESGIDPKYVDFVIENNGTIEELKEKWKEFIDMHI